MRVQVYWNIPKGVWSVRDAKTRLVIDHKPELELTDCKFHVGEAGRQRVLRTGVKCVHAYVSGTLVNQPSDQATDKSQRVRYNPKTQETFTCDGVPVFSAGRVRFNPDRSVFIL